MRNSKNLTQTIVDDLGLTIVRGDYRGRHFPTEADLTKEFSASRNIIREVVKILTEKGLLSSRPRHGTSVRPESDWNVFDADVLNWFLARRMSYPLLKEFIQIRLQIEPAAAELAALIATDEQIQSIKDAFDNMVTAEDGDGDPLEADIAFHVALLEASGNRFYIKLSSLTETALRFSIRITNREKNVEAHLKQHQDIIDAVESRKPQKSKQKMHSHLLAVEKIIDDRLKR